MPYIKLDDLEDKSDQELKELRRDIQFKTLVGWILMILVIVVVFLLINT